MLQAQRENEETKILLKRANMELEQAAVTTRTQALRQEHTDSIQQELSKARADIQELLMDNKSDEITRLQQQLSRKSLQCTREMVRSPVMHFCGMNSYVSALFERLSVRYTRNTDLDSTRK
jgi:hypothetical protein